MNISTKFNVGDMVYIAVNSKIERGRIRKIFIHVSDKPDINYYLENNNFSKVSTLFPEQSLFPSRGELIASL